MNLDKLFHLLVEQGPRLQIRSNNRIHIIELLIEGNELINTCERLRTAWHVIRVQNV